MNSINDFTIGTKVVSAKNRNRKGVVIGFPIHGNPGGLVAVDWTDGSLERVRIDNLLTEKSLEDEFKEVQNAINNKLREAAAALTEATRLANEAGKTLTDYDYDTDDSMFPAVNDLMSAMDDAGWRTSSLSC